VTAVTDRNFRQGQCKTSELGRRHGSSYPNFRNCADRYCWVHNLSPDAQAAQLQTDALNREVAETQLALSTSKADFAARQEEMRKSIDEARVRENEAKAGSDKAEERSAK